MVEDGEEPKQETTIKNTKRNAMGEYDISKIKKEKEKEKEKRKMKR